MLAHLSALAGLLVPLGSFLGPFIIWQIKKNEFPSVEAHAKASLNFQLSCLIYAVISAIFIIVGIGILFLMAVGIFSLVCVIIATIKANNGEPWKYPLSLTLIK
ncbi:orotate phosphoribosyltransferase [Nibricoccus aquaticus]|uniref:Orotate phosphoribosyltransferase n=2 Tax=Nibricoccus aquaticus TaxID=2576891 RepID=A0A290QMD5_9BACT|nr:orotate phosphoribosyltransferase [Nibricoccus aquaticus]